MKRHTKNIAGVALLALAGGAFLVDRFVLGYGPQAASAAETVAEPVAATPRQPSGAAAGAARTPTVTERVALLMDSLSTKEEGAPRDAFVIPAVWRTTLTPPEAEKPVATTVAGASTAKAEQRVFSLTGVISGSAPAAIINGRVVRVGERIGDCTLMGVLDSTVRTAVLQTPSGETLTLHTKIEETIESAMNPSNGARPLMTTHHAR